MAILTVTSAAGAPGATTTALGLALTWPGDVLLADCDRTPSQVVLAGHLGGTVASGPGLSGVLQAYRERRPIASALSDLCVPLIDHASPAREFLPGFVHVGAVGLFGNVWSGLCGALDDRDGDVVVDAGRIGVQGLPQELVAASAMIGVVARATLTSLAALRLYLGPLVDQASADKVGIVLVGAGRPYSAREVTAQFGLPVVAEIPWDPTGASELREGGVRARRWSSGRLARSYAAAGTRFVEASRSADERVGASA